MKRIALSVTLAVGLATVMNDMPAQAAPPAVRRIGQVIVDAVGAAVPSAKPFIDALFPAAKPAEKPADANAKKAKTKKDTAAPTDTVTKEVVEKVATDQAKASIEMAKGIVKEAADTSAELGVMSEFLDNSVPASQRVARILARLDQPITGKLSAAIKPDWTSLQKNLKSLGEIKQADINKLQDGGLRFQLSQIRGIYAANADDIDAAIGGDQLQDVKAELRAVQALLNGVVTATGVEIVTLQKDIDVAVLWANGLKQQGAGKTDQRITRLQTYFQEDLRSARLSLKKPIVNEQH